MRDVALASGYGSIRRFNATFLKTYGRSADEPAQGVPKDCGFFPTANIDFLLRFRPPFCWTALLEFLAPRAIPGVEIVEGETYRRVFSLHNHRRLDKAAFEKQLRIDSAQHSFPLNRNGSFSSWSGHEVYLISPQTPVRLPLTFAATPGWPAASPPGRSWVPRLLDGFELAIRAILGQQVTVQGATTLAGRLVQAFVALNTKNGSFLTHLFPSPESLARPTCAASDCREHGRAASAASRKRFAMARLFFQVWRMSRISSTASRTARNWRLDGAVRSHARARRTRRLPRSDLGLLRATACAIRGSCWLVPRAGDRGAPMPQCILWQPELPRDRFCRSAAFCRAQLANGSTGVEARLGVAERSFRNCTYPPYRKLNMRMTAQ